MSREPVELWHTARFSPTLIWRYRLWQPGHRAAVFRDRRRDENPVLEDRVHLEAASKWLARAQDISADGGVVGRYRLDRGWTSSYPETTGYIIPTFIELSKLIDLSYLERAERCVKFLLSTQIESGAFPAGEIAANTTKPSPFNSAQIINGLVSWHKHSGDTAVLDSAIRAGRWLVAEQDDDGAWRQWFYHRIPATYSAHLSCWIAELGAHCHDETFISCAARHLDWVLKQRDSETGWIDNCGFTQEEQSLRIADLHTISYTLAGILRSAQILERDDAVQVVKLAARGIAEMLKELRWIPGVLDSAWRAKANSACLTGNAQIALVWMQLFKLDGDPYWLSAAYYAIDLVKRAQILHSANEDLRGGIPGSDPMWGWYNDGAVLNWAAKFFIDALVCKIDIGQTNANVDVPCW